MVLTVYFVLSPVIGLFCHRHPADMVLSAPGRADLPPLDLTPASRRQDHTTSPSAKAPFVSALLIAHGPKPALRSHRALWRCRVHRIPCPTSVTIAKRPSVWDGMAKDIDLIWVGREREYFCKWDWTAELRNSPSGKSADLPALARRAKAEGVIRLFIVRERRITL
jgi:hypothetical protein